MKVAKSFLGIVLIISSYFLIQGFQNHKVDYTTSKKGVRLFQKYYKNYSYFIEGVGKVKINQASLKGKKLTTAYHYFSEGENRKGNSAHELQSDGSYKGTWKTTAGNGNTYQGTSQYKFNSDGTASGSWNSKGMPGAYEIRIDKN